MRRVILAVAASLALGVASAGPRWQPDAGFFAGARSGFPDTRTGLERLRHDPPPSRPD